MNKLIKQEYVLDILDVSPRYPEIEAYIDDKKDRGDISNDSYEYWDVGQDFSWDENGIYKNFDKMLQEKLKVKKGTRLLLIYNW